MASLLTSTNKPSFSPPLPTTIVVSVVLLFLLQQTTNVSCELHLLPDVFQGAVCLDGSPPAYEWEAGKGRHGASNWLVYLQGSGWCLNTSAHRTPDGAVQSCAERAKTHLGSSSRMKPFEFSSHPILSPRSNDSFFYDWNRVVVRSCDGGSFSGDADMPDPVTGLHYRGARVFRAVVEDLMAKELKNARNVLLAGGSSGGLGVMVHCDRFRRLFSRNVRVKKCYTDSSLFLHVGDPRRARFFNDVFGNVVGVHRPDNALPGRCTSRIGVEACIFPRNLVRYIESPLFILNSEFDSFQVTNTFSKALHENVMHHNVSRSDMALLRDFRAQTIGALPRPSSTKGYLLTSLFMHSLGTAQGYKGPMFPGRKSMSFESALVDWFFDRATNVHLIDPAKQPFYLSPRGVEEVTST
ncbi:unnamed protein product [Cuscuta campestris]|uniref:Pectin acetylesterase n=1 Tax=Cuscuta campestris TaxID=132261 RepID=A0A484K1Q0_9ASTE|nr:unnamed protein product [Cuscuta campestris]